MFAILHLCLGVIKTVLEQQNIISLLRSPVNRFLSFKLLCDLPLKAGGKQLSKVKIIKSGSDKKNPFLFRIQYTV